MDVCEGTFAQQTRWAGDSLPWSYDNSNPAGAAGTAYLIGAVKKDPIVRTVGTARKDGAHTRQGENRSMKSEEVNEIDVSRYEIRKQETGHTDTSCLRGGYSIDAAGPPLDGAAVRCDSHCGGPAGARRPHALGARSVAGEAARGGREAGCQATGGACGVRDGADVSQRALRSNAAVDM